MGKKSKNAATASQIIYKNTTTNNPYVTSKTTNRGTNSVFNAGTALDTINNFVNSNIGNLLESYLNPSLNTVTNQAKINEFVNNLSSRTAENFENNIINPLSRRNMIRSSQATDMYNKLAQNNASQVASYLNQLIGNSQNDIAAMLTNLMLLYMNGYEVLKDTQQQSLATSQGTGLNLQSSGNSSAADNSQMMQLITNMVLSAAGY